MACAQSVYPGIYGDKFKEGVKVPLAAESFELQDVRLLPGRFRDNMMRDSVWMVSIGVNRLLHGFRTTAGIFAGYATVKKLGGWESWTASCGDIPRGISSRPCH